MSLTDIKERRLRVHGSDADVVVRPGQTLLESLSDQGIEYPFGCTTGFCGLCKSHLLFGDVDHRDYMDSALSNEERDARLILPCCAVPKTDCVIEPAVSEIPLPPVVTFDADVVSNGFVTSDVRRLQLRAPHPFDFLAGQYASLEFAGFAAREFSMANEPGQPLIDFYIKRVPGGAVTDKALSQANAGSRVKVKGPFGTAFLRDDVASPIVAVGGGTGIAPILSMLLRGLGKTIKQEVQVYFGVRSDADLFSIDRLKRLSAEFSNLSLNVVLSTSEPSATWRNGRLDVVLKKDFAGKSLQNWRGYVAGSPNMVDAVNSVLAGFGLPADRRHCDPFLTAADLQR